MTAKLQIQSVSKSFVQRQDRQKQDRLQVLQGIDLTLGENEFVSLVGASGCGKSTLLSIVAGLQEFDQGSVLVDGRPITGPGRDRGVVFQGYTLMPWLTALGNVEFALRGLGLPTAQVKQTAR